MDSKKIQKILTFTASKNRDNIKLLISDAGFSELVYKTRKDLDIPNIGFDNNEDIKQWSNQLAEKSDKILSSKNFIKKEIKFKKQIREQGISYTESKKKLARLYDQIPINYLKNRIDFIIDKFNLPLNYNSFLRSYIITNDIKLVPAQNFAIGEYPPYVKIKEAKFVPVKIFSRLTNDEAELLKEEIARFSKQLPKYNTLKNIDRDLEIENWMTNRTRYDYAMEENYNLSSADIAENLLNDAKYAKKALDIANELKRTRKKRFKSSGKT